MPKVERRPKYKWIASDAITRTAVSGTSGDHGVLSGRGDNDHPQYLLLSTVFPSVRVYNSGDITIPNDDMTALTFDSEDWDTAGFHSTTTNTDRLTIPSGYDGTYWMLGNAQFEANAAGQRIYEIALNATTVIQHAQHPAPSAVDRVALAVPTLYQLDVDDYVQFRVYQNRGGTLDIRSVASWSPYFMMIRLGPK